MKKKRSWSFKNFQKLGEIKFSKDTRSELNSSACVPATGGEMNEPREGGKMGKEGEGEVRGDGRRVWEGLKLCSCYI